MKQAVLQKIARLRSLVAKQGRAFDVVRFACENSYARETLVSLLSTDDEQILLLGLDLLQELGLVEVAQPPASAAKDPVRGTQPARHYIGTLRG
jgi:hypothetical protein